MKKFKVAISRRERKRANKAGKRGCIMYNEEIRRDLLSRKTKFSRSNSVPSQPLKVEKKEVKKERRVVILDDDSDDDNAPPARKEPEARNDKSILEKLAEESIVKKEKKEEERPRPSEQSSADKPSAEQQERLKEKAKALSMASSSSSGSSTAASSKVDDFLAKRMFKRYRKRYNLKMCSVSISSKEKRRAEKRLHRLKGTLYLLKIMREGKLARERERGVIGQGFKRPAEPEHTSQPKRYKSGDSSAAWRSMPSFKIRKAGQDSDGFKIPRAKDSNEERRKMDEFRRMSDDKENEDIEEGFFTEEELKAKERGHQEKKKEKDEMANTEELNRQGQALRKTWKRSILRKVQKTGAIIFEVIYQSMERLFRVVTTLTYMHEH